MKIDYVQCCYCKKIRNAEGQWVKIDLQLLEGKVVSHGFCTACIQREEPEHYSKMQMSQIERVLKARAFFNVAKMRIRRGERNVLTKENVFPEMYKPKAA